ncbi:hypothetical protein BJ878DRAFT_24363 [Calycina marina]|uniref:Uncharacterized protein n=1 Tax=Calycina marina TaxID=1763456 RepID=A0A9P8CHB2_9HELO|nr:hypothetical protein BJ878DRAFT_24363 [Calycina marina]
MDELVLRDISYFEKYEMPASPETPPMKQEPRITLRERASIHQNLEQAMVPGTPPHSPRMGFKRSYSSKTAFGLPMTPPATPPIPSGVGIHPSLARTLSDSVNKSLGHEISYFSLKNRPTLVNLDVTEIPRRGTLSRSSSYSLPSVASSAASTPRDPLDRIRDYSARSTDTIFPSPNILAPPVCSPPPNTPATFEPIFHDYSNTEFFPDGQKPTFTFGTKAKDNDAYNPFSYAEPTQYPNKISLNPAQQSNGVSQDRQLAGNGEQPSFGANNEVQQASSAIADLEKARGPRGTDCLPRKRGCARKALICFAVLALLFVLVVVGVVFIILELKHHHDKHHKRAYPRSRHVMDAW